MSLVAEEFACFNGESAMEVDDTEEGEEDPFLAFVEYARSVLSPDDEDGGGDGGGDLDSKAEVSRPGWSWIAARILKTCIAYSSGVTAGILLSELSQAWSEQHRFGAPKKRPEIVNQLKKKHRRSKLPNTVTIDSVHEKNFITLSSVLEAVIVDIFVLPGTNIYMLTLGDFWSSNTIDLFMHRRYYELVDPSNEILKKGREIFLTGCYLRTAREGSGYPRLLPTEYLDQDDDAMLIAARFCSDSFSSVSLQQAQNGISYSLYARIESIGPLEAKGSFCNVQRKQVTLVDNEDKRLKFLLWGEQVLLANLLSVGSMLALDQPYITSSNDIAVETDSEICLEYGSATQLYLVPFVQHEEQVYISSSSSQIRHQGSRLSLTALTPTPRVSQVSLPCDSLGSIDFSSYPFRICRVRLDQVSQCHVNTDFAHSSCGRPAKLTPSGNLECSFCQCSCDSEVVRTLFLKIPVADETAKIFGWCSGPTAAEMLQISPDEFFELPEDEQFMYPSSLENECFVVALVNSKQPGYGRGHCIDLEDDAVSWEITRAQNVNNVG
ncbi:unnamed protein product [Linum tenue]|uniref:Nucleic acid-binding proteins superfamily n=1 Tax=Linum tenue TaxID=586396 RepID=A0AAV0P766_9ROSI|nr:unnamed protein product [Linum tenue]